MGEGQDDYEYQTIEDDPRYHGLNKLVKAESGLNADGFEPDDEGINEMEELTIHPEHVHHRHGILPEDVSGVDLLHLEKDKVGIPGCGKGSSHHEKMHMSQHVVNPNMTVESRMNEKTIPENAQNTSMPQFGKNIESAIPGAGLPDAHPHHIDAFPCPNTHHYVTETQTVTDDSSIPRSELREQKQEIKQNVSREKEQHIQNI